MACHERLFVDRAACVPDVAARLRSSARRQARRLEGVAHHEVGHGAPLFDAPRAVEVPVDTEVDAAAAVFDLGLRQRRERARRQRPHLARVVARDAVELVGDEREGDGVGAIEPAQRLEQRTVGVVMPSPPRRLTSSKAVVYSALLMAGGGGRRNCCAERSTKGLTAPQCAPIASGMRLTRVLAPLAGQGARDVVGAHARLGVLGAVVGAQHQDRRGGLAAQLDAVGLDRRRHSSQAGQVLGQQGVEAGGLRRVQRDQRVVRGLGHGCAARGRAV